jgi:hypothetical protein
MLSKTHTVRRITTAVALAATTAALATPRCPRRRQAADGVGN